jgi:FixJ family two-component response regulator
VPPRAGALHEPGGWTAPPVIEGIDAPSFALTARERQLAGFARQGLTNAKIAEALGLSVPDRRDASLPRDANARRQRPGGL